MSRSEANKWIIVAYDLPNEPSKLRVRAWRNFKKLGAVYPPVSLCLLPNTPQIRRDIEQFRSGFKRHGTILVMDVNALEGQDEDVPSKMFQEDQEEAVRRNLRRMPRISGRSQREPAAADIQVKHQARRRGREDTG
ncbi:MAG: hypothetical protein JRN21_10525 [Nitrososphaerota archaeon]|jgi:hypothetical protein|nr:hypothetical protein [Nitrososphaerota archaeon]MDG6912290.1 hypothetical protein [Nitrososphaerota archaeon]MDG6919685.1 hypothetical protein [Nitrososphaerota archaeon]MDG6941250.1 hypothetical protein [Nitrososphaerota archaeon]MDG6951510.1 hypothetical protein [Nitrososphaerota archaeon]